MHSYGLRRQSVGRAYRRRRFCLTKLSDQPKRRRRLCSAGAVHNIHKESIRGLSCQILVDPLEMATYQTVKTIKLSIKSRGQRTIFRGSAIASIVLTVAACGLSG